MMKEHIRNGVWCGSVPIEYDVDHLCKALLDVRLTKPMRIRFGGHRFERGEKYACVLMNTEKEANACIRYSKTSKDAYWPVDDIAEKRWMLMRCMM